MPELKDQEIEKISLDIDQQGLTFTPLKNELLDHICCQIEMEMEGGLTFNEAYGKVRSHLGQKRIRQIQDETLTLISKKYRRMKRFMYVLGVAAPVLLVIAGIFKFNHWPGGGILITLALFLTGMVFLPVFVMVRIRDTRRQDESVPMRLYLTGMIFGMIAILGALFKVQHFPGAGWMLTIGLVGTALVFLPMYAVYKIRNAPAEMRAASRRLWIGGTLTGILLILGALFKIMHWPGAGIVILVSWSMVAVILLPLLVLNQLKRTENRIGNFFGILLVSISVAIFVMALIRSVPGYYVTGYFMMEDNLLGSAEYYDAMSANYAAEFAEDSDESFSSFLKAADELDTYILSLREELVDYFSHEEDNPYMVHGRLDLREMYWTGITDRPYELIINRDEGQLLKLMNNFHDRALDVTSEEQMRIYLANQLSFHRPDDWSEEKWLDHHFTGPLMHSITILDAFLETVRFVEYEIIRNRKAGITAQLTENSAKE